MDEIQLLLEDNHLLVVVKPAGVPSQEDASGDPNMLTRMKAYIKVAYNKPGEVYLGLVHRLDRPVGGIMCFARTSKAAARLAAQLKSGAFKKTYLAVVEGETPSQCTLADYLYKVEEENHVYVADEHTPGAKLARLAYRTLERKNRLSLLEVELFTGRSHQIRVQLANAGFPLWGDHRYGHGKSKENIALFAAKLKIDHPTKKEPLEFVKTPDAMYPWSCFTASLERFARQKNGVTIVYEDDYIVIVEKPPGLETQGLNAQDASAESIASELVGVPVFACHRLDAMTGGLLVFAKTQRALEAVQQALKEGNVRKTYRCITANCKVDDKKIDSTYKVTGDRVHDLSQQERAVAYLMKDAENSRVRVALEPTPGAKRIETGYREIARAQGLSLMEVALFTGRTHQIRAHLAFLGYPLLGDDKYGDRALNKAWGCSRQALWAIELEFAKEQAEELKNVAGKKFKSTPIFASKAAALFEEKL